MKIVYDEKEGIYAIMLENEEAATIIHTDDIVEAREIFIDSMKHLFNEAINKHLK